MKNKLTHVTAFVAAGITVIGGSIFVLVVALTTIGGKC